MSDPVAAKSGFLSMYMSSHPDTLVAYVSHYTKSTDIATASMKSIDSKAGQLLCKVEFQPGIIDMKPD